MKRAQSIRLPLNLITAFDRLYARIPAMDCKGLCQDSCGYVPMSEFEWKRLVARHGKIPVPRGENECPFLMEGKCEHHDLRPVVCRLWGQVEEMACPHGCAPSFLMEGTAFDLMAEADRMGGGPVPDQMEIVIRAMKKSENNNDRN